MSKSNKSQKSAKPAHKNAPAKAPVTAQVTPATPAPVPVAPVTPAPVNATPGLTKAFRDGKSVTATPNTDGTYTLAGDYGTGTFTSLTAAAVHVLQARGAADPSVSGRAFFGLAPGTGRSRVSAPRKAVSEALEACKDLPAVVAHLQAAWDALPAEAAPVAPKALGTGDKVAFKPDVAGKYANLGLADGELAVFGVSPDGKTVTVVDTQGTRAAVPARHLVRA